MIQLRTDFLVFKTEEGLIPCPADAVVCELLGSSQALLPDHIREQITWALVHYFRDEQGREIVTLDEFLDALVQVLRGFGYQVIVDSASSAKSDSASSPSYKPSSTPNPTIPTSSVPRQTLDLTQLSQQHEWISELHFYEQLRRELDQRLQTNPAILEIRGRRPCVKRLASRKRWCPTCRMVAAQLLSFLQDRFSYQTQNRSHAILLIR